MTKVTENEQTRRFEMTEDGHMVFADFHRAGGKLFIDHVEAPDALRGTGAAGRFMEGLVALARASGEPIVPICSYAAAWIARHPQ